VKRPIVSARKAPTASFERFLPIGAASSQYDAPALRALLQDR
jgi:hypothetical protein